MKWVSHAPGSELFAICSELSGLKLACVVEVAARLDDQSESNAVCVYAQALARETKGVVLTELPMLWTMKVEGQVVPPLDAAWKTLTTEAELGERELAEEKAGWKPDAADDWSDVS